MTFQNKLQQLAEKIEGSMPAENVRIMHKATDELRQSGIQEKVLKVGDTFPAFELQNQDGKVVRSEDLLAEGSLVLTFYRGVWCPYCNVDLLNLKKYVSEVKALGGQLLAISPELPLYLGQVRERQRLNFDLLHDQDNNVAAAAGLKFRLPPALKALYHDKFKIDLEAHQGNDEWALPMPARFLVDREGIIRYAESNPDYRFRPDPDALLAVLKSLSVNA